MHRKQIALQRCIKHLPKIQLKDAGKSTTMLSLHNNPALLTGA